MGNILYSELAHQYARDIVAGEIPANKWVRLACQRHLDDLADADSPYRFDGDKANRVCAFISLLPHTKGKWAARGERLKLEPWQCFIVGSLFGWVRKDTGLRRFRTAFVLVPRKNGKSALAAGIGLYCLCADDEYGAEVYTGATSEKQAWEVFGAARNMALKTPQLTNKLGAEVNARSIVVEHKACKFEPLIGKPGDGASPSLYIGDEMHEQPDDSQLETMITGMGARLQPLALVISTAGVDTSGPCYQMQLDAQKVLERSIERDDMFALIYGLDAEDDWTSEAALQKANPNFGVSVLRDFLLSQQREAIESARKQNSFKCKHLNVWTNARSGYFNIASWGECHDPNLKLDDFENDLGILGLDLSSTSDITSSALLFRRADVDGKDHYYVFGRHYLPEQKVYEPGNSHYLGWAHAKALQVTDGAMVDYAVIKREIEDLCSKYKVHEYAFDIRYAHLLMTQLAESTGVQATQVPQNVATLSPAMKMLDGLIRDKRIHHNGDPVLAWCLSNVVAKEDANENVFPRKEREENKIDAVSALLNALSCVSALPAGPAREAESLADAGIYIF